MPEDLFENFSTALVAALATTLVAVSSEWLRQRGQDARLKRDVDQATGRINFLPDEAADAGRGPSSLGSAPSRGLLACSRMVGHRRSCGAAAQVRSAFVLNLRYLIRFWDADTKKS